MRVFKKRLIYDFDDAIWLPNSSEANAGMVGQWKCHGKVKKILQLSSTVFAGNAYLAAFARPYTRDVRVVPTTIDTQYHQRPSVESENRKGLEAGPHSTLTIGWTGSHSTLKQLEPLFPILEKLHETQPFRLLIIADQPPSELPSFAVFCPWDRGTEIADLLKIDIGIMPLYDTEWERGKCGFKALQYMALEIPAVVSAVGVNTEIVRDGVEGYWADPMPIIEGTKWVDRLRKLLTDPALRSEMGRAGRKRVLDSYSVEAYKKTYLEVLVGNGA